MRRIFVLVPLCALFLCCRDSGNEAVVGPTAEIAKPSYAIDEGAAITISNETEPTIYLLKCCDRLVYYVDRLDDTGTWSQYRSSDMPCLYGCFSDGPQFLPNSYFIVPVSQSHPYQETVNHGINQKGVYRFRFLYRFVERWGRGQLDSQEITSNSFTIE